MNATASDQRTFETIIGLEVHVQLKTKTKLFCRCDTTFGAEPNTQVCPVCVGMPGALPVMNEQAIELAVRTGLALNCEIPPVTKWDRKQYFYPDLPKGYQISQYDMPICADGYLDIEDPKDDTSFRVGIIRAHLEEDAGKSMHDESSGSADSRIDLNRCGTPLLEIVTQPDMRSATQAKLFLTELKLLLTHLDVSDCEMQEGSLRVDANVNLRIDNDGQWAITPIVEIKNMNSFGRWSVQLVTRSSDSTSPGKRPVQRSKTTRRSRVVGTTHASRLSCNARRKLQPIIATFLIRSVASARAVGACRSAA